MKMASPVKARLQRAEALAPAPRGADDGEPVGNPPAEFRAFVSRAIQRASALVRIAGIEPE